jgi:cell division control protein 6
LYPGVLSEELLDLAVDQTMKSGDLRVGIDLLKRAGLQAEHDARRKIEREDICKAYEISRYLHLDFTLRILREEEKRVLATLAELSKEEKEMTAGEVYKTLKDAVPIGYTKFYEIVSKLDAMRLINLQYRSGRGRTRIITLRYDPDRIVERIG